MVFNSASSAAALVFDLPSSGPSIKSGVHTEGEPELKTEEGYSADIVLTYIPGDICPHNVGTMSA